MGATQMRFWKTTSRIRMDLKRVGGSFETAVPEGGDCSGLKYGALRAPTFLFSMVKNEIQYSLRLKYEEIYQVGKWKETTPQIWR